MTVTITTENGQTVLAVNGMLDTSSAPEFWNQVSPVIEQNDNIIVDLADLIYISSQGIRTLLTLIKTVMSKEGTLKFKRIRPAVMEILDMSGISEVMTVI